MKLASATALFAIAALSVHAADLDKYKNWDQSPQGYFMTHDEGAQWSVIATDEDAENFIAEFLARRGPKFAAEVATRAQNADKYLTIGKLKGSQTLRGKIVILFGPPASMDTSERKGRKDFAAGAAIAHEDLGNSFSAPTGSRGGGTATNQTMTTTATPGLAFRDFTFTFTAKSVPALGKDFEITIEADAGTGKDRIRDKKKAAELDEKFEAVAKASIQP